MLTVLAAPALSTVQAELDEHSDTPGGVSGRSARRRLRSTIFATAEDSAIALTDIAPKPQRRSLQDEGRVECLGKPIAPPFPIHYES